MENELSEVDQLVFDPDATNSANATGDEEMEHATVGGRVGARGLVRDGVGGCLWPLRC